jgi:hypothetical protein
MAACFTWLYSTVTSLEVSAGEIVRDHKSMSVQDRGSVTITKKEERKWKKQRRKNRAESVAVGVSAMASQASIALPLSQMNTNARNKK